MNHSWKQKTRDTGLSSSLYVPSFWHNAEVWRTDGRMDRQTDGQTGGRICHSIYTVLAKLCFAERCNKIHLAIRIKPLSR